MPEQIQRHWILINDKNPENTGFLIDLSVVRDY